MKTVERTTKDIYLAAVWMALGATYERVDRTDPRHQEFTFSTIDDSIEAADGIINMNRAVDMEVVEKEWANGTLVINAVQFKDAIQRMKAIIHSY